MAPALATCDATSNREADERALAAAIVILTGDYPDVPRDRVEQTLRTRFDRTKDAPIQQYRVVLAERDTRAQLRREAQERQGNSLTARSEG